MMRIIDCIQGSEEWFQARAGIVTASEFKAVLSKGQGITRKKYMYRLIAERLSGKPIINDFQSKAMEHGTETEERARSNYTLQTGNDITSVGFVKLNDDVGCSPDGLTATGGVEIKCPDVHTHIEYLLNQALPSQYKAQVQGCMWVCEKETWDFVSYDYRIEGKELLVIPVARDNKYIANLDAGVNVFLEEMHELEIKLKGT